MNELRRVGIVDADTAAMWGASPSSDIGFIIGVAYDAADNSVCVDTPGEQHQRIEITWSACRFGGTRPWFSCPGCRSRRIKLYLVLGEWQCRTCHGLKYETQRLRKRDREALKARRIRARLGQTRFRMGELLPERPPRMRLRTYFALEHAVCEAELAYLELTSDSVHLGARAQRT